MSKVTYASLKLKVNSDINTFDFNGTTIEVLKYLPVADKYDLIMVALQKAEENGIYNELMLDMYFHLYLVYMYTNLTFTEKQKEDEAKIYDSLKSNGFFDMFLATIEEEEYSELWEMMNEIKAATLEYKNTAGAVLQSLINDLPSNAEAAAAIVDSFNPEKYRAVVDFAKSVGNRE